MASSSEVEFPSLTPVFPSVQEMYGARQVPVRCPSGAGSYFQNDVIINKHHSHTMSSDEVTLDGYLEIVFSYLIVKL